VTPGTYSFANLTIDSLGRITSAVQGLLSESGSTISGNAVLSIYGYASAIRTATTTTVTVSSTTDSSVLVDAATAAGNVTVNLPTAVGIQGRIYRFQKIDTGTFTVTIDPSSTQTIDGSLTRVLRVAREGVVIQSDGANWQSVGTM
jgi:hypothetical protein